MTIKAVIHQAEEGGYWAEIPSLPGCFSQGETIEEVTQGLREALEGWMLAANDIAAEHARRDKKRGHHQAAELVEMAL